MNQGDTSSSSNSWIHHWTFRTFYSQPIFNLLNPNLGVFTVKPCFFLQILKGIMIVGIILCIFLGTILSKMTVLLATGNILRKNNTLYCIQYQYTYLISNGTENVTEYYAKCITPADNYTVSENSDSCLNPDSVTDEVYQTGQEYSVCSAVSIRWIWSLILILITPEFFVLCRNIWIACFKKEDAPSWSLFFKVRT